MSGDEVVSVLGLTGVPRGAMRNGGSRVEVGKLLVCVRFGGAREGGRCVREGGVGVSWRRAWVCGAWYGTGGRVGRWAGGGGGGGGWTGCAVAVNWRWVMWCCCKLCFLCFVACGFIDSLLWLQRQWSLGQNIRLWCGSRPTISICVFF